MMLRRFPGAGLAPAMLAVLLLFIAPDAQAQRPGSPGVAVVRGTGAGTRATRAERRTIDKAFQAALAQPKVRAATIAEVRRQLRTNKPVAFVDGAWVTPVRLREVYASSTARSVIAARTSGSISATRLNALLGQDLHLGLGFAFIPKDVANVMMDDMAADVAASLAGDALTTNATDMTFVEVVVVVIGIIDALIDYFSDDSDAAEGAEGVEDASAIDHPDADPDGDGVPNRLDADDDGDETNDDEDGHPYDPGATICMCFGLTAVTFVASGGPDMIKAVVDARSAALKSTSANARVAVGAIDTRRVANRTQPLGLSIAFAGGLP